MRRLAAEGLSIRKIAGEVFGDTRLRGRVERILRAPTPTQTRSGSIAADLKGLDLSNMDTLTLVRLLARRGLEGAGGKWRDPLAD